MSRSRRRIRAAFVLVAAGLAIATLGGGAAHAATSPSAKAAAAIQALKSAFPTLTVVPTTNPFAKVPACDGIAAAETLATQKASATNLALGGAGGVGITGRVLIFKKAADAKKFLGLVGTKAAGDCIGATYQSFLPAAVSVAPVVEMTLGTFPGAKTSVTLDGTIKLGSITYHQYTAVVQRSKVIIQAAIGELAGAPATNSAAVRAWVDATFRQFT